MKVKGYTEAARKYNIKAVCGLEYGIKGLSGNDCER